MPNQRKLAEQPADQARLLSCINRWGDSQLKAIQSLPPPADLPTDFQQPLRIGFIRVMEPVPAAAPRTAFAGVSDFTDGLRGVLWLSEQPVALDDTVNLAWELLQYEAK